MVEFNLAAVMGKGRTVYFKTAALWEELEKIAKSEQRSVNFVIERIVANALQANKVVNK